VTTTAKVPTDIAIAQAARLRPVADIAADLGLDGEEIELYGRYKAKVRLAALARARGESIESIGQRTTDNARRLF